jgi:hypothetical protein
MEQDYVKPTPLRISTKVVTANMGTTMSAKNLFENISQILVPMWWPGQGILKMEHEKSVIGYASRDMFSKRGVSDKPFFNQSTIVLRRATNPEQTQFKEVNVKLFGNGGIQMTGIPAEEFALSTLVWLLEELQKVVPKEGTIFTEPPQLKGFKVQLINSDYQVAYPINRSALHSVLARTYGLFSTFESTIYQGVNTKYYYNEESSNKCRPGLCFCSKRCRGQGSGSGPGECKRITMSVFQTGKIIITGGRFMYQLDEAYNFLNAVLQKHAKEVLRLPSEDDITTISLPKSAKSQPRLKSSGKTSTVS